MQAPGELAIILGSVWGESQRDAAVHLGIVHLYERPPVTHDGRRFGLHVLLPATGTVS